MLVALNQENRRVYADEASKTDKQGNKLKYYCPECGAELILKQGTKNIWHFSHKNKDTICLFRKGEGGESIVHQHMKKVVKEVIEQDNDCLVSELEWKVGNRVADYYFEVYDRFGNRRKVAVECVHKHTDINEFRKKNQEYVENEVFVLWIFNLARFLKKDNDFKDEVIINEMIKEAHTMYYGKVYCIDLVNKCVYGIHFDKVTRYEEADTIVNSDGEELDVGGRVKYLKSRRYPVPYLIKEFKLSSFKKANEYDDFKYLNYPRFVVNVYINKWWD